MRQAYDKLMPDYSRISNENVRLRAVRDTRAWSPLKDPTPSWMRVRPDRLQVLYACRECGKIKWEDVQVISYEEAGL